MSRRLHLLVTSERPDPYLNSVAHCVIYEGVREVEFLYIHGFGENNSAAGRLQGNKKSATVLRWVTTLLEDLATVGEYRYFMGEKAGVKVDLRQVYPPGRFAAMQEAYRQCLQLEIQWSHRDIPYSDLRSEIAAIAAKRPSDIVDVSSVKKTFLGDLFAASVVERLGSLHVFDLDQRPDFEHPWAMLFHEFKASDNLNKKHQYINLLDTYVFRECSRSLLVKRPPLLASLLASVILLSITIVAYFAWGASSWFVQGTFLLSVSASIASILSLFYSFFPLRR